MRKTITIVAALLAAFFLTSCDQILEGFYPEFADSGMDKGSVVISVSYDNSLAIFGDRGFSNNSYPICVALIPFSQNAGGFGPMEKNRKIESVYFQDFTTNPQTGKMEANVTFLSPYNASSKVLMWLDVDKNQDPTNPESPTTAPVEPGRLVYSNSGDWFLDLSFFNTSTPSIYMGAVLGGADTINWDQYMSDPSQTSTDTDAPAPATPSIYTPMMFVGSGTPTSFESMVEMAYEYEGNVGWIVDRKWTIQIPGMLDDIRTGMQYLPYTFNNPSAAAITATVKLTVQDNRGNWSPETMVLITVNGADYTSTNQLPIPIISGTGNNNYSSSGSWIYLWSESYDMDGWVNYYEWKVAYPGYSTILSSNSSLSYQMPSFASTTDVTVSLRVQDNSGAWSTSTAASWTYTVYATASNQTPTASFSMNPSGVVTPYSWVTFTDTSWDDGYIYSRQWYVNGSLVSSSNSFNQYFGAAGTYTVELDVWDAQGEYDYESMTVTVGSVTSGTYNYPYMLSYGYDSNWGGYGFTYAGNTNSNAYTYYQVPYVYEGYSIDIYNNSSYGYWVYIYDQYGAILGYVYAYPWSWASYSPTSYQENVKLEVYTNSSSYIDIYAPS